MVAIENLKPKFICWMRVTTELKITPVIARSLIFEVGLRCISTRQSPFRASQIVYGDRHVVWHRSLPVIQPPREDECIIEGN
jgi:hypothetical protein